MNYRFTEEQRRRLTKLGLYEEQVCQLDRAALPAAAAALAKEASLSDVRDKLADVKKAIIAAKKATAELLKARDKENCVPEWREVFQRIERAEFEGLLNERGRKIHGDGEHIDRAAQSLAPLSIIVAHAFDAFELEAKAIKRRHHGTWFAIQLIDEALQAGFMEHHRTTEATRGAEPPPYNLKPSTSETSRFFKVVAICYEVIGREERSLEAPIRAYIEWQGKKEQAQ